MKRRLRLKSRHGEQKTGFNALVVTNSELVAIGGGCFVDLLAALEVWAMDFFAGRAVVHAHCPSINFLADPRSLQ